ncbi:MAG TPA: circularly permuted type 2 ATP-grasp protein [Planctomycetaceae bacterium]|nr:circularly permuted type 2 ATP-grasp protein [Planctomycetaceae bacterium]
MRKLMDVNESSGNFDELLTSAGTPRHPALSGGLASLSPEMLAERQRHAEEELLEKGITFAVYGHNDGNEKVWPFDVVPRPVAWDEWITIEAGLKQRIRALNLFLDDVYGDGKIMKDGVVPEELVKTAKTYRPECQGFRPPGGVWTHVVGTDLVRNHDGTLYVLEDNLRCPSGVSYVLENREIMKRVLPEAFYGSIVASIEDYPERLLDALLKTAPAHVSTPTAVVLTPGVYNSAYFEHSFLAQQMGIELVNGSDLFVDEENMVWMKTTRGPQRVDVIYRRIDDDFIDPECFRADSMLGVPGLMRAYRAGNVTLANAPGTGVADDKAVYQFVPAIIRYYLSEDAILQNVPTYLCSVKADFDYVLGHLDELVVKPTNESGGYGILMGPQASQEERDTCAAAIRKDPRNYIAQPMLTLSTVPTVINQTLAPRHVDLRPFILFGEDIFVLPGGLTRVALKEGSMIVNSSQGGGSKDTWVLLGNS